MKTLTLDLIRIGNSRGIRLPADLILRHEFEHGILLEDKGDSLVLRSKDAPAKLSWEETGREMGATSEDWSEWEDTLADGLKEIPWDSPKLPQKPPTAKTRTRKK